MFGLCLFASVSEAAISVGKNVAVELFGMETPSDLLVSTIFIFFGYTFQYVGMSGIFEATHPAGSLSQDIPPGVRERRRRQVQAELRLGVQAMLVTVFGTALWMYAVEPYTYFYAFFQTHEYNVWWFLGGTVAYIFWFDTWFFFTHKWLHEYDYLWYKVHIIHHQFKEPSAFAQFATHPIEAAIQGPIGHYIGTIFFPFHPVALAATGFIASAWAIAAHDGRALDLNSHYFHHSKGRGRWNYFNLGFITPFWDIIYGTRWHPEHPLWQKWQENKNKTMFDTTTGTPEGESNDRYQAYGPGSKKVA